MAAPLAPPRIPIAEAAEMLRISPHTLRRWEREGKIPPPRRDHNGWRYFDLADIEQIRRIAFPMEATG